MKPAQNGSFFALSPCRVIRAWYVYQPCGAEQYHGSRSSFLFRCDPGGYWMTWLRLGHLGAASCRTELLRRF